MKPRNFPGRVNERRKRADPTNPKIVGDIEARAVRTKKTKADGWSAARAFHNTGRITR